MANFMFRKLQGDYRGGTYPDWSRINACFKELSQDIPSFDTRISLLENASSAILTDSNFVINTISGSILKDGTILATKLAGSITGSMLVSNSADGITNANIASNAAISISKLDLSTLSHSQLLSVGTLTHAQLESTLTTLTTSVDGIDDGLVLTNAAVASVNGFLGDRALSTTASDVTDAINELKNEIASISVVIPSGANFTGNQDQYHIMRAIGANHSIEESPIQALDTGVLFPSQAFTPSIPASGVELYAYNNQVYAINTSGDTYNLCQATSSLAYLSAKSPVCSGVNAWCQMTDNFVTLTPGTWEITGHVAFNITDSVNNIGAIGYKWASENGNNGSSPAPADPLTTLVCGMYNPAEDLVAAQSFPIYNGLLNMQFGTPFVCAWTPTSPLVVTVTSSTPIYLDPWCSLYNTNNILVQTFIYAKRLT
jgi:hypothetical protein